METLKTLWNSIVTFMQNGNNLYYCIGGVVVVIIAIILIAVFAKKKGKKADSDEEDYESIPKYEPQQEALTPLEEIEETVAPYGDHTASLAPTPMAKVEEPKDVEEVEEAPVDHTEIVTEEKEEKEIVKSVVVKPVKTKKAKPVAEEVPEEVETADAVEEKTEKGEYKRGGYAQIYKDKGGKFRFRLKASNQNIVAHSQDYTTKSSCKNGIKAVANAADKAIIADTTKVDYVVTIGKPAFEVFRGANDKFYFRLRAANTNNILSSQGYTTKENCLNGIRSVTFLAHNHTLIDDTVNK